MWELSEKGKLTNAQFKSMELIKLYGKIACIGEEGDYYTFIINYWNGMTCADIHKTVAKLDEANDTYKVTYVKHVLTVPRRGTCDKFRPYVTVYININYR